MAKKKTVKKTKDTSEKAPEGRSPEDKQYLIDYIKNCKKEAEDATKTWREQRRELWLLYQSRQDYSKKKDWQSKCFIPKVFMAVIRATSLVKRAVLQIEKLFKMELSDEETEELNEKIAGLKKTIRNEPEKTEAKEALENANDELEEMKEKLTLDEKKFKRKLDKSNFVNTYGEATESGFLMGLMGIKRIWDDKKKNVQYENTDVLNLYISPDYLPYQDENPNYLIEYKEMGLAELRKIAKATNKAAGKKIFDLTEIRKIKEDYKKIEEESRRNQRRGLSKYEHVSKKVGILEFWGDVVSKDGETVKENQLMMLANEKHLIRVQDNPFDDKKYAINLTVPLVYPHRGVAGNSLVQPIAKLQQTINNVFNMCVDNLNFSVNKVYEVHSRFLLNPKAITTIFPGKVFQTNTPQKAVREVETSPLKSDVFKIFELIGSEIQEGTSITEFLMGMPGKKAKTLGEIEIKTAESQGLFDVIARDLERNSIKPLLEDSYNLFVQFGNFSGKYDFSVGGLSLLLAQKEQVENLMQVIAMAIKEGTVLGPSTNIRELWKRLLGILNFSDVFIEEEEQEALAGEVVPIGGQIPGQVQPQITPEQQQMIEAKAAEDARAAVAQIPPQEIATLAG